MNISNIHQLFLESSGICTDTRKIVKNNLFFALKGANFNGNEYAKEAIKQGASYAIIDNKQYHTSDQFIVVNDVLETLQHLATYHRNYLAIPIIALTGSNGKTTTKELINCVLSAQFNTTATSGNLNNHIGVPLTLLSMDKNTEIGIVEMGANHLKEIAFLCNIAQPDFGYITNIGKAHLEGFGGIEGVLKGKTELYQHLREKDKLVFLNSEDPKLLKASSGINTYTFSQQGSSNASIQLQNADPMVSVTHKDLEIQSNLIGVYNFTNIAAAIAIGSYFKVDEKLIKKAIESYIPSNNRSQIIAKNDFTIIMDAYNANPSSMNAAIDNLKQLESYPKTVFLGDMFELGKTAEEEHQKIADKASSTSFDVIFLIGENFYQASTTDPRVKKYRSFEDLQQNETFEKLQGTVLIKGSRGMKLERVLDILN
ncbi:UDP-N-acetylmuramoyl-tripeptide--D-alanyl-D-alanine ligase [uncultured Aquimarina sp.]|uniref:UDP-N-acetylmuramoyl-tripeptide--D-alanyl-D- alanine ligase n=1 Tax=uncultured Aquimarina sp. TaxID=575652 RepID=UPI00262C89B0|nr:UDP-N-acetylmuramoyl-tripeptide--D-alanyl-D-alanine ligase [uncultured Aquimarina sp.]